MMKFFPLVLLLLTATAPLAAQKLVVHELDPSGFPQIRLRFTAVDAAGSPVYNLTAADLSVVENGGGRIVTSLSCPPPVEPERISVGLMIDAHSHDALVKAGARRLINFLQMPKNELGMVALGDGAYVLQDFTRDRATALAAAGNIEKSPGTDLQTMFYDRYAGGIPFISGRPTRKVLVLLTDLHCPKLNINEDQLYADAARERISIYSVLLNSSDYGDLFKRIASRTGGRVFTNVTTAEQIENIFEEIVILEQYRSCEMTWNSELGCTIFDKAVVSIPSLGATTGIEYVKPFSSLILLDVSPSSIRLGSVAAGTHRDTTVTITARNRAITIDEISSSNPAFTILSPAPPLTLGPGESRDVVVRYTAADDGYAFTRIDFKTDACRDPILVLSTGRLRTAPPEQTLKLTHPNGGEEFLVGTDTVITWEGLLPDDPVRLEYSVDNGATWDLIREGASGLSYPWEAPNRPSDRCLARVTQMGGMGAPSEDVETYLDFGGYSYDIEFTPDGSRVVVGGVNSMFRVFDVETGEQVLSVTPGHANTLELSPDGLTIAIGNFKSVILFELETGKAIDTLGGHPDNILSVAFSPDGTQLASADERGQVIIWDMGTRAEITRFKPHGQMAVRQVAYHPDGLLLASIGYTGEIKITEIATGTVVRTFPSLGEGYAVAFSPDGRLIAGGGASGQMATVVWDFDTGEEIHRFFSFGTHGIEFSPDGWYLYTAGSSWSGGQIYDLSTGEKIREFPGGGSSNANDFAPSPDGYYAAIATDGGGFVTLIRLTPGETLQQDVSDNLWSIVDPRLELATIDIDMGELAVGKMKDSLVVATLCNRGNRTLDILGIDVTSGNLDDFLIMIGAGEFSLPPGACRDVTFTFMPTAVGYREARITIRSTRDTLSDTIRIHGVGISPRVEVLTAAVDFGQVPVGSSRDSLDIIILKNTGSDPITFDAVTMLGPDRDQFSVLRGAPPFTLQPNDEHRMDIRFAPVRAGRTGGRLGLSFDGPESPAVVRLYGEGVEPRLDAKDLDAISGCDRPVDTVVILTNSGRTKLTISDANIEGGEFSLQGETFPLEIWPGESDTLKIRFTPGGTGGGSGRLLLRSDAVDALDSLSEIALTGRSGTSSFTLSSQDLNLGAMPPGTPAVSTVDLTNTGSIPLSLSIPVTVDDFTIESMTPSPLQPGATAKLTVRFAGKNIDGRYTAAIHLTDQECGSSAVLRLSATVTSEQQVTATATIEAPDLAASPGEIVEVAIRLRDAHNLSAASVSGISTTLRYDASLLLPLSPTPIGTVINGERIIPLDLPVAVEADSVVARLRFRAALGRDTITSLVLESSSGVGGTVSLLEVPGRFRLTGVCVDDDPRLFFSDGMTRLKPTVPNPVRGSGVIEFEVIEDGPVRLYLNDSRGEEVEVLYEGNRTAGRESIRFDAEDLPTGIYWLTLETATRRLTREIRIVK